MLKFSLRRLMKQTAFLTYVYVVYYSLLNIFKYTFKSTEQLSAYLHFECNIKL